MLIKIKGFPKKHFLSHRHQPLWKTAVAWSFVFTKNLFGGQSYHRLKKIREIFCDPRQHHQWIKGKIETKNYHQIEIHSQKAGFPFFQSWRVWVSLQRKSIHRLFESLQTSFFIVVGYQTKWYLGLFSVLDIFSKLTKKNVLCIILFLNRYKSGKNCPLCMQYAQNFFFIFFTFLIFLTLWAYANPCVKQLSK